MRVDQSWQSGGADIRQVALIPDGLWKWAPGLVCAHASELNTAILKPKRVAATP